MSSVAARTAGSVLAEPAAGTPQKRVPDLAGPQRADLVTLARHLSERLHLGIEVQLSMARTGVTNSRRCPSPDRRRPRSGPTFNQGLTSDDDASAVTTAGLA
jgi:hypothetical protein